MSMKQVEGYPLAHCDEDGCEAIAPPPKEWMEANPDKAWPGWNALGWDCTGGSHFCPRHHRDPAKRVG